jgi:hypothetical protein
MKRSITLTLALAISAQALPLSNLGVSSAFANPTETVEKKTENESSKFKIIQSAIRSYNVILDKTGDKNAATMALAEGLAQSESISANDLKRYIGFRVGENSQTYKSFQAAVEVAVSDLDVSQSNLSEQELGNLIGSALTKVEAQGLQFLGCANLPVGIVVAVAAVVVGIVALAKSKSEDSIARKYDKDIYELEQYSRLRSDRLTNATAAITERNEAQASARDLQKTIDRILMEIPYYNGVLNSSLESNNVEVARNALATIERLHADLASSRSQLESLNARILQINKNWGNILDYHYSQFSSEMDKINREIESLNEKKQRKIEMVPIQKKQAMKLGIAAGIGAGLGIFLIIDIPYFC